MVGANHVTLFSESLYEDVDLIEPLHVVVVKLVVEVMEQVIAIAVLDNRGLIHSLELIIVFLHFRDQALRLLVVIIKLVLKRFHHKALHVVNIFNGLWHFLLLKLAELLQVLSKGLNLLCASHIFNRGYKIFGGIEIQISR